MALHYYSGDYKRLGKQLDATAAITPKSGSHIKDKGKDLYNGNISAWTTYTGFDQTGTSTADPLMGQGFRYDKLNRLTGSFAETMTTESFTAWTANSISRPNIYQENLKYDANGNIDTLIRTSGNVSTVMDNMFYRYASTVTDYYGRAKKANNKLEYIDDDTDVSAIEDITDQASGNYVYDAKGRLVKDVKNEIETIKWTPYDKVQEVIRTTGSSKPRLQFTYDAMGRRVSKKVIRSATDSTQNSVTYYAYDASGNVMGVYEKRYDSQLEYKYTVTEEYIYGSSRVGSYNNGNTVFDSDDETPAYAGTLDRASLRFEITDHLGNVRAVVGGTRTLVEGGGSNLIENPSFDTHSGGLGTDWGWSNNAQGVYSIVTGNGFNGNAQRAERAAGKKRMVIKTELTTVAGGQYRISFKYRSNVAFRITGHTGTANGFTENNIAADSVNAKTESYNKIAVGNEIGLYFDINKNDSLTYWLEIDDVEVVRTDVAGDTYYQADIKFLGDYYPFGSQMPGRKFVASDGDYRYGFNGMEKTDEVYGDGNEYTTEFRQYDPRVGRWFSPDPLMDMFADQSPYNFVFNSPLVFTDILGLAPNGGGKGNKSTVKSKHGNAGNPGKSHKVKSKESLWSISKQYGVAVNDIVNANQARFAGKSPGLIYAGETINIPVNNPPPVPVNSPVQQTQVGVSGYPANYKPPGFFDWVANGYRGSVMQKDVTEFVNKFTTPNIVVYGAGSTDMDLGSDELDEDSPILVLEYAKDVEPVLGASKTTGPAKSSVSIWLEVYNSFKENFSHPVLDQVNENGYRIYYESGEYEGLYYNAFEDNSNGVQYYQKVRKVDSNGEIILTIAPVSASELTKFKRK